MSEQFFQTYTFNPSQKLDMEDDSNDEEVFKEEVSQIIENQPN